MGAKGASNMLMKFTPSCNTQPFTKYSMDGRRQIRPQNGKTNATKNNEILTTPPTISIEANNIIYVLYSSVTVRSFLSEISGKEIVKGTSKFVVRKTFKNVVKQIISNSKSLKQMRLNGKCVNIKRSNKSVFCLKTKN
jgi:hypothetical protein